MPAVVEAKSLTKKFGNTIAVDHIDFDIQPGQCFGFLGPNGAGKTTTMRMIYLLSKPSEGELKIFDEPVKLDQYFEPYHLKQRIGVVPQEDNLDQELTTADTLEVFCRFYGLYGEAAKQKTKELLEYVKLTDKADAKVMQLSGGMRRRLQIARSMISSPDLLILDEPTTGLDPQIRNQIWDFLKSLKKKRVTMVLTTHYMSEAEQLCDDIVIMDLGKIIARGHPQELIRVHVPKHVVEWICDTDEAANLELYHRLSSKLSYSNKLTDRFLFYVDSSQELVSEIHKQVQDATIYHRYANLEDVFVKLTGKSFE